MYTRPNGLLINQLISNDSAVMAEYKAMFADLGISFEVPHFKLIMAENKAMFADLGMSFEASHLNAEKFSPNPAGPDPFSNLGQPHINPPLSGKPETEGTEEVSELKRKRKLNLTGKVVNENRKNPPKVYPAVQVKGFRNELTTIVNNAKIKTNKSSLLGTVNNLFQAKHDPHEKVDAQESYNEERPCKIARTSK